MMYVMEMVVMRVTTAVQCEWHVAPPRAVEAAAAAEAVLVKMVSMTTGPTLAEGNFSLLCLMVTVVTTQQR